MDTLQAMRLFARVVEMRSFSAVARAEKTTQPTVSKTIAGLERTLGVRLIERSTTSLAPTDEGQRFYLRCKQLAEDYDAAVADVRGQTQNLVGVLSVSAPLGLGELYLNGLVIAFLGKHPDIQVELILNDRIIDLVEEGIDVAIRLGGQLPPNVIARPVATFPRVLVAAPGYLDRAPPLLRPEDLGTHQYIRFARLDPGRELTFTGPDTGTENTVTVRVDGRYQVNSSLALRHCFLEGVGLGSAPAWLVQDLVDDGRLVRLLADWDLPPQPVHLVYPSRRNQPLRVTAFLQFMTEEIRRLPGVKS